MLGQRCPGWGDDATGRFAFSSREDARKRDSNLAMAWHHDCSNIDRDMARTILVVDDEPELVASCERLLQRVGHVSVRAYTGPEAVSLIDREKPDLVVADLRLPGADGLAVARHARARVPPIPVILMTAYDSWQARQAASESGVDVYLAKPFSNAAFLDAVLRVLPPKSVDRLGSGRP
jgi:two-component system response regulator (stage 0 sporulation protein F)